MKVKNIKYYMYLYHDNQNKDRVEEDNKDVEKSFEEVFKKELHKKQ